MNVKFEKYYDKFGGRFAIVIVDKVHDINQFFSYYKNEVDFVAVKDNFGLNNILFNDVIRNKKDIYMNMIKITEFVEEERNAFEKGLR